MADELPPYDTTLPSDARVLSHLAIRQLVGLLGFALPSLLYAYARLGPVDRMQPSISEFYYTAMGDVMVGCLVAIGVFLLTYRGYATTPPGLPLGDRGASVLAGLGAIGTALVPTTGDAVRALCYGPPVNRCFDGGLATLETGPVTGWGTLPDMLQAILHFGSAALFLGMLAYFCLVLFPIGPRLKGQNARAMFFRVCGVVILICMALVGLVKLILPEGVADRFDALNGTFWLETLAVFAFSIAWLVKGKPLKHPLGMNSPQPRV
ncbi:hypothetical protein HKCCE4037_18505 [Rhodobacterales bacterium HKCCE4037]|nr:hypothetical protein [Rhodobacterales bacterium HKCCE4037]